MLKTKYGIADRYQDEPIAPIGQTETELVRSYGGNALAFFGLALQNSHFLTPGKEGLLNYQRIGRTAIVLGDPICAPPVCKQVTRSFLEFCARLHWRTAFYQASATYLPVYQALNMHAFKIGEEAILHPQTFTLSGSAMANVRTSCRRAEREGVIITWYEGVPPASVMAELEEISTVWLERKTGTHTSETSFSTGRVDDVTIAAQRADMIASGMMPADAGKESVPRFVTAVARTSAGQPCAFVTFTPIYGIACGGASGKTVQSERPSEQTGWGWALDLMRRTPDALPGVMELLLVQSIERFRAEGAQVVSLGLVAMADTRQEIPPGQQQLISFVANRLGVLETRDTLFKFKQKFQPSWESRYLVTNATLALPKIALAVLHLRNYSGGWLEKLITKLLYL